MQPTAAAPPDDIADLQALHSGPAASLEIRQQRERAFHDVWTRDCGLATWARDPVDALARAKALLRSGADGAPR